MRYSHVSFCFTRSAQTLDYSVVDNFTRFGANKTALCLLSKLLAVVLVLLNPRSVENRNLFNFTPSVMVKNKKDKDRDKINPVSMYLFFYNGSEWENGFIICILT